MAAVAPVAVAGGSPPSEPEPPGETNARAVKTAYLTFDDGPDPRWTPQVLAVLRRHHATATFFVIGSVAQARPALLQRIVREGHALGNHTYTHADLTRVSRARFYAEVDRTEAAIRRITRRPTRWLRPPYGAANATTHALAAKRGYRLALWDVDPQDWRRPGVAAIAGTVLEDTGHGEIVLMHDGGGDRSQTVAALERVLAVMSARGYTFRALR